MVGLCIFFILLNASSCPKCRNRATYMRYKCKYSFVVSVKPSVVFKLTKRLYSQKKKKSLSSFGFNYDK